MPDTLEGTLNQAPGLSYYLSLRKALGDQAQREQAQAQQQQFVQERTNLGQNPSAQDLIGVATKYADPTTLLHYGQASLDRREATAARLQQANELARYHLDNLEERRINNIARLKDKQAQDVINNESKKQQLALHKFIADNNAELGKLRVDVQQQRADTAQQAVEQRGSQLDEPLVNVLDKIDATTRMIKQNPEAVGGRGMLGRGAEFVSGMVSPGAPTPASDLQTQILDLQRTYRGLPGHAAGRLRIDASKIDSLIKGLGTFTAPDQALNSLQVLRDTISKQFERRGGGGETTPQAAPANPADRKANEKYMTPRGVLQWTGTGWITPAPTSGGGGG